MPSLEESLLPNETLFYKSQVHYVVFAFPVLLFIISIACFQVYYLKSMALLFFVIGIGLTLISLVTYAFSEFAVTNKRVLIKRGLLTQTVTGLMLEKIESIQVKQDIPARILNYGDIDIIGTGSSDDHISQIQAPYEFRNAVLKAMQ